MDLICTVPRPHLLGRALIWPGHFAELSPEFLLYIFRVYQSLRREFVSPAAGNASLVFISDAILFLRSQHVYLPLEVEFRGKRFIRKGHGGRDTSYLVCYIVWRVNLSKLSQKFV